MCLHLVRKKERLRSCYVLRVFLFLFVFSLPFAFADDENKIREGFSFDSPFGVHPAVPFEEAGDIGIKWSRGLNNPYIFWFLVDPGMSGNPDRFQWQGIARKPGKAGGFDYDKLIAANKAALNILYNIEIEPRRISHRKAGSWLPLDEEAYRNFVREAVKRYSFIKYWQIGNEPVFNEKITDYGRFVAITYEAIKEANPQAKVLLGGVSGLGMPQDISTYKNNFDRAYLPLLKDIARQKKRCFDIFDFHFFGRAGGDYRLTRDIYRYISKKIKELNIPEPESYWITETGTYSGDPKPIKREGRFVDFAYQSEKEQAIDLVKRYVYPLSFGIKKVFWAWGLKEGFHYDEGFFDFTGLIYDGRFDYDQGSGVKKLSYYAFKKMIEVLEGSDWNHIITLAEDDNGVYIYRFTKQGRSIWVAWNDAAQPRTITIDAGSISAVKISEVVPKYDLGKEVPDYVAAFNAQIEQVRQGKIPLTLKDVPLFIIEQRGD